MLGSTGQNDPVFKQSELVEGSNLPERETTREMPQLCTALKDIIKHLYKLSMIIHRPVPTDRLRKSSSTPVHGFHTFDRPHTIECYPRASPALQNRLANCITRRRQLLIYNERHHNKLSDQSKQFSGATEHEQPPGGLPVIQNPRVGPPETSEQPSESVSTALTESLLAPSTEATHFIPPESTQAFDVQSESGTVSSFAFSETCSERIRIPPRPRNPEGEELEQFLCPFCFRLVEIRNSRVWA